MTAGQPPKTTKISTPQKVPMIAKNIGVELNLADLVVGSKPANLKFAVCLLVVSYVVPFAWSVR